MLEACLPWVNGFGICDVLASIIGSAIQHAAHEIVEKTA
jgi:hypothetical protein